MSAFEEELTFFPCGGLALAGVMAIPTQPNGQAVVIAWGAGAYPSSGRNRVRARLARSLAEHGFHAFRFDNIGVGESEGAYRKPDMGNPNTEEIMAAAAYLESRGIHRLTVIANCFGGWSALMAAPQLAGLEAMVVLNSPVRRDHQQVEAGRGNLAWWAKKIKRFKLSRLLQPEGRASYRKQVAAKASLIVGSRREDQRFSNAIDHLLKRRVPLLLVYDTGDFRVDLESELERGLGARLEADPTTRLVIVDERLEGFASLRSQDLLIELTVPWLSNLGRLAAPTD